MTIGEVFNAHELERIGYYRAAWDPRFYVTVAASPRYPTGTPNHRWLVSQPSNSQWKNYYLSTEDAAANDWSYVDEDVFTNYALSQGCNREEDQSKGVIYSVKDLLLYFLLGLLTSSLTSCKAIDTRPDNLPNHERNVML